MDTIVDIILHCSKSRYGNAALITKWHLDRGFDIIGYHYCILNGHLDSKHFNKFFDGYIETGRPLDDDAVFEKSERGAHTRGHNLTIGICLIGNSGDFTKKQITSMLKLVKILKEQFGNVRLTQHSDWNSNKSFCAGITDMDKYRRVLKVA
jgi:hypothetical protein